MSYPDAVYFGESGEVSAHVRRSDTPPDLVYANGGTVDYLARGATTDGGLGLYRWNFGTGVSGPDPHFHRTMSEYFFVLSGKLRLHDGTGWVDGHPGDFLHVPPGGIHGFRNESGEPASMLLMFTPGAPREAYFETLAKLGQGMTMTDEERDAFMAAHDNIWI